MAASRRAAQHLHYARARQKHRRAPRAREDSPPRPAGTTHRVGDSGDARRHQAARHTREVGSSWMGPCAYDPVVPPRSDLRPVLRRRWGRITLARHRRRRRRASMLLAKGPLPVRARATRTASAASPAAHARTAASRCSPTAPASMRAGSPPTPPHLARHTTASARAAPELLRGQEAGGNMLVRAVLANGASGCARGDSARITLAPRPASPRVRARAAWHINSATGIDTGSAAWPSGYAQRRRRSMRARAEAGDEGGVGAAYPRARKEAMAWRADGEGGRREGASGKRDEGRQQRVMITAGEGQGETDSSTHRGQPALARTIPRSVVSVGGPGALRTGTPRGLPQRRHDSRAGTSAQGVPMRARAPTQSGVRARRMSRHPGYADGTLTSSRHTGGARRRAGADSGMRGAAGESRASSRASPRWGHDPRGVNDGAKDGAGESLWSKCQRAFVGVQRAEA
ncbi:hypothetical protein FB451DRAFT_1568503 [Mycena latifolia]|nr:hypothetical protein FB451DRAFT_1568503 [Mycena latifolia]